MSTSMRAYILNHSFIYQFFHCSLYFTSGKGLTILSSSLFTSLSELVTLFSVILSPISAPPSSSCSALSLRRQPLPQQCFVLSFLSVLVTFIYSHLLRFSPFPARRLAGYCNMADADFSRQILFQPWFEKKLPTSVRPPRVLTHSFPLMSAIFTANDSV